MRQSRWSARRDAAGRREHGRIDGWLGCACRRDRWPTSQCTLATRTRSIDRGSSEWFDPGCVEVRRGQVPERLWAICAYVSVLAATHEGKFRPRESRLPEKKAVRGTPGERALESLQVVGRHHSSDRVARAVTAVRSRAAIMLAGTGGRSARLPGSLSLSG